MAKTSVVPATQELVDLLKGKIREADIKEVFASSGEDADRALQLGFQLSEFCWVGLIEDEPVTCFGARRISMVSDRGVPWLLGTDGLSRVTKTFVKESRGYVQIISKAMPYLENYVDVRNALSIRWLKWCGFTMAEKPEPFGKFKLPFFKFWLKGADNV